MEQRCPCCRKKTDVVLGDFSFTARGWNNFMGRETAARLARDGTCPWCGRQTTIVAKILLGRFEPYRLRFERSDFWGWMR